MTQIGTQPAHTPFGQRLRERTQPLAFEDAAHGYAHAHLAEALAQPLLRLQQAFDPEDAAPFETLLDPERCPDWALPWLAQLVGIALPSTASVADQRTIIAELASHKRGTTAMLRAAAGLHLTGDKTVYFRERDQDGADPPYALQVVTLVTETPDPDAVLAALMAQKPGGIILNYGQVASWDYQEMTTRGATQRWSYASLPPMYATYADLAADRETTP
jgi:Phage tail protein (Tail_P2_I)